MVTKPKSISRKRWTDLNITDNYFKFRVTNATYNADPLLISAEWRFAKARARKFSNSFSKRELRDRPMRVDDIFSLKYSDGSC